MALPDHEHESIEEILQDPLEALARLGLHRPSRRSLESFFEHLAEHQVISSATAAAYAALYQEMRYGEKEVDLGVAREVSRRLKTEIERFAALPRNTQEDVIRHVCAEPSNDSGHLPEPPDLMPTSVEQISQMANQRDPTDHLKPKKKLSSDNKVRLWGIGFIIWTVAMIFIGYGLSDRLRPLLMEFRYSTMDEQTLADALQDLESIREFAANHPNDARIWRIYGDIAFENEAFNEAIMAYHYALIRQPEDAETLNNLAWLYCTAKDEVYRDIDLALDYAARAWELKKASHIADTLAEAHFVNGDREKAIELEEEALRRAERPDQRQFYEEQLKRFRGEE